MDPRVNPLGCVRTPRSASGSDARRCAPSRFGSSSPLAARRRLSRFGWGGEWGGGSGEGSGGGGAVGRGGGGSWRILVRQLGVVKRRLLKVGQNMKQEQSIHLPSHAASSRSPEQLQGRVLERLHNLPSGMPPTFCYKGRLAAFERGTRKPHFVFGRSIGVVFSPGRGIHIGPRARNGLLVTRDASRVCLLPGFGLPLRFSPLPSADLLLCPLFLAALMLQGVLFISGSSQKSLALPTSALQAFTGAMSPANPPEPFSSAPTPREVGSPSCISTFI